MTEIASTVLPWALSSIPFARIERDKVRDDENLFFVLASASLIESGSDIYTHLLINHFGDSVVARWLASHWEQEELQHGRALRLYVERTWPEFDWQPCYDNFLTEYSTYCSVDELEPSLALELAARCVIETGTATLYRALQDYTDEPVLKLLTGRIRADEVRHYKHFHRFFVLYNQGDADTRGEGNGRWKIFEALARRIAEIRNEDADCALRHVFKVRYPDLPVDSPEFRHISTRARALVMRNASADMMVKMFLKPLALSPRVQPYIQIPVTKAMQRFLLH